jgi:TonB family protein
MVPVPSCLARVLVASLVAGCGGGRTEPAAAPPAASAPAPAPAPARPKVPDVAVEDLRIAGVRDIQPDIKDAVDIARRQEVVVSVVRMCVDREGVPRRLSIQKQTRYPAYDHKIVRRMNNWRFRPLVIEGKVVPFCTSVTFVYRPRPIFEWD